MPRNLELICMVFASCAGRNPEVPRESWPISAWYTFLFVYLSHVDNYFLTSLPFLMGISCLDASTFGPGPRSLRSIIFWTWIPRRLSFVVIANFFQWDSGLRNSSYWSGRQKCPEYAQRMKFYRGDLWVGYPNFAESSQAATQQAGSPAESRPQRWFTPKRTITPLMNITDTYVRICQFKWSLQRTIIPLVQWELLGILYANELSDVFKISCWFHRT